MSKIINKLVKHRKEIMKEKKLSLQKEKNAWYIRHHLKKQKELSGVELAELLNTSPINVRKAIQLLRERNHLFFDGLPPKTYIVASQTGYKLSKDITELQKYRKQIKASIKSKKLQLQELEIAIMSGKEK